MTAVERARLAAQSKFEQFETTPVGQRACQLIPREILREVFNVGFYAGAQHGATLMGREINTLLEEALGQ